MDFVKEVKTRFSKQKEYLGEDKPVNKIKPLVSVCVQTYQHEDYIQECLDGILMQETNFPYEIILGEDDSKDNTRDICIEYAKKHPDRIRLYLRERSLTQLYDSNGKLVRRMNGIFTRMSARGKYIALCDGDDFWTDPFKLKKQVHFLQTNPDYGAVFTDADIYYQEKGTLLKSIDKHKNLSVPTGDVLSELMYKNPYKTCTSMILKNSLDGIYDYRNTFRMGDILIWLHISKDYKIGYIPESTTVYRVLNKSASHANTIKDLLIWRLSSVKLRVYFSRYHSKRINYLKLAIINFKAFLRGVFYFIKRKYKI